MAGLCLSLSSLSLPAHLQPYVCCAVQDELQLLLQLLGSSCSQAQPRLCEVTSDCRNLGQKVPLLTHFVKDGLLRHISSGAVAVV